MTKFPQWQFLCFGYDLTNKKVNVTVDSVTKIMNMTMVNSTVSDVENRWPQDGGVGIKIERCKGMLTNMKLYHANTQPQNITCKSAGTYLDWNAGTAEGVLWNQVPVTNQFLEISREQICNSRNTTFMMLEAEIKNFNYAAEYCEKYARGSLPGMEIYEL